MNCAIERSGGIATTRRFVFFEFIIHPYIYKYRQAFSFARKFLSNNGGINMETKKKRKKWPWVLLAIVVVLVIVVVISFNNMYNAGNIVTYDTYTVTQGSITSTVTGSGELESVDIENIDVLDGIKISEILVEVGDNVTSGDALATLDADSLKDRAASLSNELSSLDSELSRMSSNQTTEYVYASVNGRIKYLPVSNGSEVIGSISEYGSLALISTDGLMQVEITSTQDIAVSSKVTVKWQEGSITGKIAEKTAGGYLITLNDDKAPYNKTAQVYDGDTLLGEGILDIHAPVAIFANGGTISKVHVGTNDKVNANTKLFTLGNKPFSSSYQQKLTERADKAEQLATVLKYRSEPWIVASADGIVSTINVTKDTETGSGASSGESTAFVINTGGALKMKVAVDELDIHSITLDQGATVTLDAIASEKFAAMVTSISNLGNADGSITTFTVNLILSPDARFLPGMNGNATILVDQAENVLIIPIAAINEDATGAFVYVGSTREKAYITTGLSDGEYAEVVSGLSEGDVIQYIGSSAESEMGSLGMQNPFGGGGMDRGMGGGGATDGN